MSQTITIQGTVINFPTSGTGQDWAQAVDDFAVAVQNALLGVVGPADVTPQTLSLNSFNPGTNINIPNLTFSNTTVMAAFIKYSVVRTTSSAASYEAGTINIVFNVNGSTNNKWEIEHRYTGNGQVSFTITDAGQVQITTQTLAGTNHVGVLSYTAQALLNSY